MPRSDLAIQTFGPDDVAATVVLVHGAPDRAATFKPLLEHLASDRPVSCRVVSYDRRGYGRSLEARPPTSMADHADDLVAVLEDVVTESGAPAVVVAHSFGSNPTMLAATERPELLRSVGLWEPPIPWVEWWPQQTRDFNAGIAASDEPEAMIEDMYRRMLGDEVWAGLAPDVQARRRAEGHAFRVDMASILRAPLRFEDVGVPAVVGYGTETSDEHVDGARWLAEQLPDADVFAIEGAGHFANRTHPVEYARFVRAAIDRGAGRTSSQNI